MKRFAIALLVLVSACDDAEPDSPEVAAAKTECKSLLEHIVQISPQGQGLDAKKVVADLPIEDIQGCVATNPFVKRCFGAAKDVAAIKACPDKCVRTLMAYRDFKRSKNKIDEKKQSPTIDAALFPAVDKCLAGDQSAADDYKLNAKGDATLKADPQPSI